MKWLALALLLSACAVKADNPSIPFDYAAYARSQGWCGQTVTVIYYDKSCKAKIGRATERKLK